ncbi:hypothetical protein [Labrys neptuniae]|uniref:Uncharacterized protein n=1 Tax=Labrys neptuniae TaxID=376174 RepID=A0ABV3PW27_9HYPH
MNGNKTYSFLSDKSINLKLIIGKRIDEILAVEHNFILERHSSENKLENHYRFSFDSSRIYIYLEDFGTLAFASQGSDHRSLVVAHLLESPSMETIAQDLRIDEPFTITRADDTIYSEAYFASFLGTNVIKIETIQAHEAGRRGARRNERGLRITNDKGHSLIIGWKVQRAPLPPGMCIIKPDQMNTTPGLFSFHEI